MGVCNIQPEESVPGQDPLAKDELLGDDESKYIQYLGSWPSISEAYLILHQTEFCLSLPRLYFAFTVFIQQPYLLTCLMFPDYPNLHNAFHHFIVKFAFDAEGVL